MIFSLELRLNFEIQFEGCYCKVGYENLLKECLWHFPFQLRYCLQIWLLILNKFKRINNFFFTPEIIRTPIFTLREKCPNMEFFLVRIFLYSDWIRTRKNSVFAHFSRSVTYSFLMISGVWKLINSLIIRSEFGDNPCFSRLMVQ